MDRTLAIISPLIGARSETFIRRHLTGLMPGQTACLYQQKLEKTIQEWNFSGPSLQIQHGTSITDNQPLAPAQQQTPLFHFTTEDRKKIQAFFQEYHVKVLLSQYMDQSLPWIQMAKECSLPLYVHAHGYDVSMLLCDVRWRKAYRQFNHCAGVITVNQVARQRLIELGIRKELIHVIPCGVDQIPATIRTLPGRGLIRCLAVGRMVSKKAPIHLLKAFIQAYQSNPDLRLNYIGDGPLMKPLQECLTRSGLGEYVEISGSKPHSFVLEAMAQSDIFLHHAITDPDTGDEEGLPVAILEAMQHALPVISTYHAGIPEAVINHISGRLHDEGDISGMAKSILQLAASPDLRHAYGAQGKQISSEKFSWALEKRKLLTLMNLG